MIVKKDVESAFHTKQTISSKRRKIIHATWISPIISIVAIPTHAQTSQITNPETNSDNDQSPQIPFVRMHVEFGRAAADYNDPAAITSVVDSFTGVDLIDLEGELLTVEYSLIRASSPSTEEMIDRNGLILSNTIPTTSISAKSLVAGSEFQIMNALPGDSIKVKASFSPTSIFEGSASTTKILEATN